MVIIVCNAGYTINLYMMYLFRHEEEMYRLVITDYEERQKQLMVENTELRSCLNNMQKELVQLLNEPSVPSNGSQVNKTKVFFSDYLAVNIFYKLLTVQISDRECIFPLL